jgi:ankyrin repeat protein
LLVVASPLHYAAYAQRDAVVSRLLKQHNIDWGSFDSNGQSALTVAVRRKATSVIQVLLGNCCCFACFRKV